MICHCCIAVDTSTSSNSTTNPCNNLTPTVSPNNCNADTPVASITDINEHESSTDSTNINLNVQLISYNLRNLLDDWEIERVAVDHFPGAPNLEPKSLLKFSITENFWVLESI